MAKQNVTFIERHLEKFVIGTCGAVLLVIAGLYLIDTPNKVEVDNQPRAPKNFYSHIQEEADLAVNKMKNARFEPFPGPGTLSQEMSPIVAAGLPPLLGTVFVPPSPSLPALPDGLTDKLKIELADILPPIKPMLTTGRSTGKLPESEEIQVEAGGARSGRSNRDDSLDLTKDYIWATVVTAIDRKKQREYFEAKGYSASRLALYVADIIAERQELLPDGRWAEAQLVHSYAPTVLVPTRTVRVVQQEKEFLVPADQMSIIEAHHLQYGTDLLQAEVLRPPFKDFLDDQWSWTVPKSLKGVDDAELELDWEEFGVLLPEEEEDDRPGGRAADDAKPGRPARGAERSAAAAAEAEVADIVETVKKADKLIAEKKYLDAEELLLPLKGRTESDSQSVAAQARKAEKLLEDNAAEIEQARVDLARNEQRKIEAAKFNFGPDIDPVWINDTTVTPGKTYRYRVQVLALNKYAGLPAELKNPLEARKLVLDGQWSDWSEAIQVKPNKQLFFTGIDSDNRRAKVEFNQWASGKWKRMLGSVDVGQPLTFKSGTSLVSYDATVVEIDLHRRYPDPKAPETRALVLVNSLGEVEERLEIEERDKRRDFSKEKEKDDKRDRLAQPQPPRARPQMRPRPANPRGGPREQPGS